MISEKKSLIDENNRTKFLKIDMISMNQKKKKKFKALQYIAMIIAS